MMTNRLEVHLRKPLNSTAKPKGGTDASAPPTVAPGRLPGIRSNVTRITQCSTSRGDTLAVPVTVESNIRHTSKGQKRKRNESKKDSSRINFANVGRKHRGKLVRLEAIVSLPIMSSILLAIQPLINQRPRRESSNLASRKWSAVPITTTKTDRPSP